MIGGRPQLWIRARGLFMLPLRGGDFDMAIARRGQFL
jgi:hypothetical protein